MSKLEKKQGQHVNNSEEELHRVLRPLKVTKIARDFINTLDITNLKMPTGKNADSEKFLIGLSISLCLFYYDKATLLKKGGLLKKYVINYAKKVPLSHTSFIINHVKKLVGKEEAQIFDSPPLSKRPRC